MRRFVAVLLLPFALVACGDDSSSSGASGSAGKQGANQSPKRLKPKSFGKDTSKDEAFVYRSDGVRDPFQPFIVNVTEDNDAERCALCVPLSSLSFTAVVTGIASPVALVETREGVGYFARRGSELGANGGRIIDIREGVILLRERFQDQLGRISVVDRSLRIRSQDPLAEATTQEDLIDSSDPKPANNQSDPPEEERVKKTSGPADEL